MSRSIPIHHICFEESLPGPEAPTLRGRALCIFSFFWPLVEMPVGLLTCFCTFGDPCLRDRSSARGCVSGPRRQHRCSCCAWIRASSSADFLLLRTDSTEASADVSQNRAFPASLDMIFLLHSKARRPLRFRLNLRIFPSSSASTFLVKSSRANAGVHSSSGVLMHLRCNGRLGESLLLTLTRISFWLFLSLDSTSQTIALACSCPRGTGMPREVKKEL